MEHHATVDKGLKMKIKKKKTDSKVESRPTNSHSHNSNILKEHPKPYHPLPLVKQVNSETTACDKLIGQERSQAKKDKHKHDKHGNKVTGNSQLIHKCDLSAVKQEKISKSDFSRSIEINSGHFNQLKHENKQITGKRTKETPLEHHSSQYEASKDGYRSSGCRPHDPYEFNSKEEDQVNRSTPGGLLLGLSAMKLKTEKVISV